MACTTGEASEALNDAGWLPFVGVFYATFIQVIAVGLCILQHPEQRVFPRWLGFFNLWVGVVMLPDVLIFWFKSGPFAWNGIAPFWVILCAFCVWFLVMSWAVQRAVRQQVADERQAVALEREPIAA
ncbi:hypothetical protein SK069_09255 [Patulibacter brassicae]|jgi:hypothetical protein|uniref:Uncharacterized protein n=1 Tax=Patulibacter brassicae TaxID=1705717 RepID=A0ABU4VIW8_9ACTN|nr:hypothetical protein [Patulibacter brassicae]MDX8151779.1 hypothetical protein [Patulibacter brassicae]